MGPYLQLRMWAKEAPVPERVATSIVGVLVLALLLWAFVPVGGGDGGLSLASGDSGSFSSDGGDGGTGVDGGAGDSSSSTTGADGSLGGSGGSRGGSGSGGSGGGGTGTSTTTGGKGSTPSTTTGGGGTGTTTTGPTTRTASDRGVTADSVKVGFTILNLAGVDGMGFATNQRDDTSKVIDALVDDANKKGGFNGRRVVAVKKSVDLIDQNDQRAKCLEFTETDKVFAVIDTITFVYEATKSCVTKDHQTPLLNTYPASARYQRDAYPYDISPTKDDNRRAKDWVFGAKEIGFFDPAKGFTKLGLLTDSCEPSVLDDEREGLKAYLKEAGVTAVNEFRLSCDSAAQSRQVGQAAVEHAGDRVSHVLLAVNALTARTYVQTMESQLWTPKYSVSDLWNLTNESQVRDFPRSFDDVVTVSQLRAGELRAGKPLSPMAQQCSKILTDHGLAPITGYNEDLLTLNTCEAFQLFLRLGAPAGVNPTRASFTKALSTVAEFRPATLDFARYDRPNKTTGGDTVATIQFEYDCHCWTQVAGFRPAYG